MVRRGSRARSCAEAGQAAHTRSRDIAVRIAVVSVKPVVGGRSCQNRHVGYASSGSMRVTMDDGTTIVIQAGDGYEIPPGHQVEVLGEEQFEAVEFAGAHTFGLGPMELGERILATALFSDIVGSTATLERLGEVGERECAMFKQRRDSIILSSPSFPTGYESRSTFSRRVPELSER